MKLRDNTLLITYHPMIAINGGTMMYNTILSKIINKDKLFWIGTGASTNQCPIFITKNKIDYKIVSSFIFHKYWLRIFTKIPFVIFHYLVLYLLYTPYTFFKILKIINQQDVKLVWSETFKQTYILAFLIKIFTKCSLHLSINDHFTAHSTILESKFLELFFKKLINMASSFDFISDGMVEYYKSKYGLSSEYYMVLWIGPDIASKSVDILNNEIKNIVFYGSIHGFDTFYKFCDAIEKLNMTKNKKISLHIFSEFNYKYFEKKYTFIKYKGSLPNNALVEEILNYDLVYIPMFFDKKYEIVSHTSISSKMILAINAGLPVFSHAPKNSANSIFVEKYNLGITCDHINTEIISSKISNFTFSERMACSKSAKYYRGSKLNNDNDYVELEKLFNK